MLEIHAFLTKILHDGRCRQTKGRRASRVDALLRYEMAGAEVLALPVNLVVWPCRKSGGLTPP